MGQFITYAQNNEDVILAAYFKDVDKGTYVDVGANHPVRDSVTKHFYDKGWRGINVEPIDKLYALLERQRPDDINVKVGVSDKPGVLQLREYTNDGLSTFLGDIKRKYAGRSDEKTATYKDVDVPVVTLAQLFADHPQKHIHFMKIDVEGLELEVLKGNDWKKFRPEMICIEANHRLESRDWRPILTRNGYTQVWNDGLNDYYLAKESMKRKKNFSYPEVMLLSGQVIPYHVIEEIERGRRRVQEEEVKMQVQQLRAEQLERDNKILHDKIQEQQRFSRALFLLLKAIDRVILTQIERLHQPRASRIVRPNSAKTQFDGSSREALLTSIRTNDLHAYFSLKKRPSPPKYYLYHMIMSTYLLPQRALRKAYRGTRKLARGRRT